MSYWVNIGYKLVKHWFKVSVKHQLVLACFYMRVVMIILQVYFVSVFEVHLYLFSNSEVYLK